MEAGTRRLQGADLVLHRPEEQRGPPDIYALLGTRRDAQLLASTYHIKLDELVSSALTVPTSSSTITSSTTSTHAATAAASSTPSPEQPPPSGLSAGAGAGIGIGCVAAIAGVVLVAWLWRRERRKRRLLQEQVSQQGFILDGPPMYEQEPPSKTMYAHVHAQGSTPEPPPQELEDRQRGEVEGTARNEAP